MESGIYKIQSKSKPERCYIGSAVNLLNRKSVHLCDLIHNRHGNIKLQRHYNKYGVGDLEFSVLIKCEKERLVIKEQCFINIYNPYFNICKTAGNCLGIHHSKETRDKMSKSRIGLNTWSKGRHHSEESKKKYGETMSKILKGRKHSTEHNINNGLARRIPILQYTKNMVFIKEWDSATTAGKELKISNKNINHCLKNCYGYKTVGGYVWKYKS
jgi:group I intron endonuclease